MNLKSLSISAVMLSCTTVTVTAASHPTGSSQTIDKPLSRSDTVRLYLGKDGLQYPTPEEANAAKPHGKPSLVDEEDAKKQNTSSTITPPSNN